MYYADIKEYDVANGPGVRISLFVSGCTHHCEGCFNEDAWDFHYGKPFTEQEENRIIEYLKNDFVSGITLLGGEPFEQAKDLAELSKLINSLGLSIVCFTGYTIEELKSQNNNDVNNFLLQIDLLIDGGFEKENYDLSRPWVGSSNQRYHFLTNFYTPEIIKKYKNKIEVHINQNGKVEINGMGDFSSINKNFCLQLGKDNVK